MIHNSFISKIKYYLFIVSLIIFLNPSVLAKTSVKWENLGNEFDKEGKPFYTQRFTIQSDTNFNQLAFNMFAAEMIPIDPKDSVLEIVPGYYALVSPKFKEAIGNTVMVDVVTDGRFSKISFAPDGAHLVMDDGSTLPVLLEWGDIISDPRFYATPENDKMPYGDVVFQLNNNHNTGEVVNPYDIVPSFKQVRIKDGEPIKTEIAKVEYINTLSDRKDWMRINIDKNKIVVETNNQSLARSRIENLLSRNTELPPAEIEDWPDFDYRALMIDIVRNYQTPQEMQRILNLMSRYGLNVLHFHITDDEAWRLEIPGLPELTEVGGKRGYTLDSKDFLPQIYAGDGNPETKGNTSNGFFTRNDFISLLQKADSLGISIIPEIESPGHARAAIYAMENRYRNTGDDTYRLIDPNDTSKYSSAQAFHDNVMDISLPGPLRFMTKVASEVQKMYKEAGVELPAIHIGGDEVAMGAWKGSPSAQKYMTENGITDERLLHLVFVKELGEEFNKLGIPIAGWQEIAVGHSPEYNASIRPYIYGVNVWSTLEGEQSVPAQSAKSGFPTVLSNVNHYYLDQSYNYHPNEPGLIWGGTVDEFAVLNGYPKLLCEVTEEDFKNVKGISGQLFSETIRSPQMLEQFLLPKLPALAERAWNMDSTYSDSKFNAIINAEMPVWYQKGYNFHVAQPGIVEDNGWIIMNTPYPDAVIRYTLDGTEPTLESQIYSVPIKEKIENVKAKIYMPQYEKESLTTVTRK